MTDATTKRRQLAASAGIDEPVLEIVEGFAGAGAATADLLLGDVVPGLSLLTGRRRRIVAVALEHLYVFEGGRFGRVGSRLGSYGIAHDVVVCEGDSVRFPDGQSVAGLSPHQVGLLERAAHVAALLAASAGYLQMDIRDVYNARQSGKSLNELAQARGLSEAGLRDALESVALAAGVSAAQAVMNGAGISGERPVVAERGESPKTATGGSRLLDATIGGGELDFRTDSEPRIVLVTDRQLYIFEGRDIATPGRLVSQFRVGETGLSREDAGVSFPDGTVVVFKSDDAAKRVAEAAANRED